MTRLASQIIGHGWTQAWRYYDRLTNPKFVGEAGAAANRLSALDIPREALDSVPRLRDGLMTLTARGGAWTSREMALYLGWTLTDASTALKELSSMKHPLAVRVCERHPTGGVQYRYTLTDLGNALMTPPA